MQFSTILAVLMTSAAIASAIPNDDVSIMARDGGDEAVTFDGVPDFDAQELYDDTAGQFDERDVDTEIESRATPAQKIVDCAKSWKGTKYLYGGCKANKPFGAAKGGMDCSCLSRTCVYKGTGKTINRVSRDQYNNCKQVSVKSAQPGDLLFWGCGQGKIHHVGIYSKKNYIIHAPHTGTVVKEAKVWSSGLCPKAVRCW